MSQRRTHDNPHLRALVCSKTTVFFNERHGKRKAKPVQKQWVAKVKHDVPQRKCMCFRANLHRPNCKDTVKTQLRQLYFYSVPDRKDTISTTVFSQLPPLCFHCSGNCENTVLALGVHLALGVTDLPSVSQQYPARTRE